MELPVTQGISFPLNTSNSFHPHPFMFFSLHYFFHPSIFITLLPQLLPPPPPPTAAVAHDHNHLHHHGHSPPILFFRLFQPIKQQKVMIIFPHGNQTRQ
ncbi:hypothetical protein HanRHA438_Chr04g0185231 [Helianthus annuus]|nr:hypothetical protein HanRHA438_Chr04g0185231 [Helianthus annuus]